MYLLIPVSSQKFGVEDTVVAKRVTAPVSDGIKSMDLIVNSVLRKPCDLE